MRRSIVFCVMLAAATVASAGHFHLKATLRSGKSIEGYVPEKRAAFEGLARDGKTVKLRFQKLPSYAKRPWSQEIQWDEKRGVFVLRAPSWTGELERIWEKLILDPKPPGDSDRSVAERELEAALDEGKRVVLKGSDVAEVKIRYIDPATEVIKPKKK